MDRPIETPETVSIPAGLCGGQTVAAFRIGRTPVTNREYAPFLAALGAPAPPWWSDPAFRDPGQPVVGVAWDDAAAYCAWLSETAGGGWRLPSEAEWEHAMSGGRDAPATPWGDAIPEGEIPEGRLDAPWIVGRGTPNGYGVLDPGTVVHEWCLDWRTLDPAADPAAPPSGPARRASRGGSWRHRIRWSPPSAKSSLPPAFRYSDYGFRVLRENPTRTARRG